MIIENPINVFSNYIFLDLETESQINSNAKDEPKGNKWMTFTNIKWKCIVIDHGHFNACNKLFSHDVYNILILIS